MPKINEPAKRWRKDMAARVGNAVRTRRGELGMTAAALARRTAALGYPVSGVAIGKLENNHREGKFDLGELLVLAAALDIPPVALLFGGGPDEPVEMLPGQQVPVLGALAWFTGDEQLADDAVKDPDSPAATLLQLARKRTALTRSIPVLQRLAEVLGNDGMNNNPMILQITKAVEDIEKINATIGELVTSARNQVIHGAAAEEVLPAAGHLVAEVRLIEGQARSAKTRLIEDQAVRKEVDE